MSRILTSKSGTGRNADWDAERYEGSHRFVWEYGADLLSLLRPQPGERILDVGCGTGQLTARIAELGAEVVGIDKSPSMIAQARRNFPRLSFHLADAAEFRSDRSFDAVFSNAALHWMLDVDRVAEALSRCLRPGGRLVAEMGAKGNIERLTAALRSGVQNYFPSAEEYSAVLQKQGLTVTRALVFDRLTPLEHGDSGLEEWIAKFRPDNVRPIEEVKAELRPDLFRDGKWYADYRRLRIEARKI